MNKTLIGKSSISCFQLQKNNNKYFYRCACKIKYSKITTTKHPTHVLNKHQHKNHFHFSYFEHLYSVGCQKNIGDTEKEPFLGKKHP